MKKWIFITTCTVGVLLSAVNVYNTQGAWNTLSGGLKQECYFSEKMRNYVEMREYADPPVLTSFLITPMCMSSTADMGINSSTYSFLIDGGLQKAPNAILCRRDIYNTGLHIWHVKLAAQGIFKDVQVKRNNENCVNISNVVFNQSNCEFIVSSETPLQRESTTLLLYIYNSCIVWDIEAGLFSTIPGPLPD